MHGRGEVAASRKREELAAGAGLRNRKGQREKGGLCEWLTGSRREGLWK